MLATSVSLFLTACGGRQLATSVPSFDGKHAAVMGDSERQILSNVRAARSAGKQPVYVEVDAGKKNYVFPVYAQVLRTTDGLIVRSYGHAYIFPLATVHPSYGDARTAIDTTQLPLVKAPRVDRKITSGAVAGAFTEGDVAGKKQVCPDCIAFFGSRQVMRSFAARWNGIKDPWQQSHDYAPWAAPPAVVPQAQARVAKAYRVQNCVRTYEYTIPGYPMLSDPLISSNCWSNTYSGGGSGVYGSGGGGGGGGSDFSSCYMSSSDPSCGYEIAGGSTCTGALAVNSSVNGSSDHNSQISNSMAIWSSGPSSQIIAYEYQTYGGQEYIQFDYQMSVSANAGAVGFGISGNMPIWPFNGNVYSAFQTAIKAANLTQNTMGPPWSTLSGRTDIKRQKCTKATGGLA